MKKFKHSVAFVTALLLVATMAPAQTLTILHSFAGGNDGATPYGSLILSGSTLYGPTSGFDPFGSTGGTIFKVNTDGSGYTILSHFGGSNPFGSLNLSDSTLYGMTYGGPYLTYGVVFKMGTNNTGYTELHTFAGSPNDGANNPYFSRNGSLALIGSTLYGMTWAGGAFNKGVVYMVNTNATGYAIVHDFAGYPNDGENPDSSLTVSGTTLYGMTHSGGASDRGVVFRINADGTGYTNLHFFAGGTADGAFPCGSLTLYDGVLYGMTSNGGTTNRGVVFRMNADGSNYTNLHSFTGYNTRDGDSPNGSLTLNGNTLYGMTAGGGVSNDGTVFQINTNGSGYAILHSFDNTVATDGAMPIGSLTFDGGVLYGMTTERGMYNKGAVFSLTLPPLTITTLSSLPAGTVGVAYSTTLAATNGVTPYSWSVVSNSLPAGLTLVASSGSITGTPTVATTASFRVRVTGGDSLNSEKDFSLTIVCSYALSASSTNVTATAGSGSVGVTTGGSCGWTATNNVSWLTITAGSSGTGNGTVNYTVASNAGNCVGRTGTLTIAGQTFTVTQAAGAGSYAVAPSSTNFPAASGSGSASVTAGTGCNWTASSGASWLTITSGSSGSGNGTVNYAVASNASNCVSRVGTLTVAEKTFTVNQTAGTGSYSISPASRSHTSAAETGSITVTAGNGCSWTTSSNDGWLTITGGSSGTGNGTVNYAVASNSGNCAARSGSLTIAGQTFTVNQAAGSGSYAIAPTNRAYGTNAASDTVSVTVSSANCSWTATSLANWLTILSGSNGMGNGTVSFAVAANTNYGSRAGSMTIAGQTFTATQDGQPLSWQPALLDCATNGTMYVVWTNGVAGATQLWRMDNCGNLVGSNNLAASAGWSFQDLGVRRDGKLHALWTQGNNAQVWTLNSAGTLESSVAHVSSNGWVSFKMIVAPDNKPSLVWTNTGGRASIWPLSATGAKLSSVEFTRDDSWRLNDAQINPQAQKLHLFWHTLNGTNILWTINTSGTLETGVRYPPAGDRALMQWMAGTDGNLYPLWVRTNDSVSVWTVNSAGSTLATADHVPINGTECLGIGPLTSGKFSLGWENTDGTVELWRLSNMGVKEKGCPPTSPGSEWNLALVTADAAGKLHLLWQATDGRIRLQRYWLYNCTVECEREYAPPQ